MVQERGSIQQSLVRTRIAQLFQDGFLLATTLGKLHEFTQIQCFYLSILTGGNHQLNSLCSCPILRLGIHAGSHFIQQSVHPIQRTVTRRMIYLKIVCAWLAGSAGLKWSKGKGKKGCPYEIKVSLSHVIDFSK